MAVDDQEEVVVIEECKFDGDWKKAAAIDVALTYAITTVDDYIHKTHSEVRGRTPINASFDFTLITTIFQTVLTQKGYVVLDAEDLGKLNDGATRLLKKVTENKSTIGQLTNRVDYLEELIERKDKALDEHEENLRLISERDEEIRSLREQLAALQPQSDESDEFKASECAGDYPYNPSNGMPCIFKASDPGHPGSPHKSEGGGQWWDHHGENEAAARLLQHEQPAEPDFKASKCDGLNPYRSGNGAPCKILPGHDEREHEDDSGFRWWDHQGVGEEVARRLQQNARERAKP